VRRFQYQIKPEIANVLSDQVLIPYFSYGQNLDNYVESSRSKINISFSVDAHLSKPDHLTPKFHYCYGAENAEEVYFERPLPLGRGLNVKLHCKNLMTDPQIRVNKTYYKLIRSKIDNTFPPGVHLADILSLLLLKNNYFPLHCAAISSNNEGIVLAAPPDTGKSMTTMFAVKRGYGFLSEDIAIADDKYVYSNPQTTTFYHMPGFKTNHSLRQMLFRFLAAYTPAPGYFVRPPAARIYDILKDIKIDLKVPIKYIFILAKGRDSLEELDPNEALRRIRIINRNEFSFYKNTLLFAYSYFNRSLDINALMQKEERLIENMTSKVKSYLVQSADAANFINIIDKAIYR
jgi:hypothetical protein